MRKHEKKRTARQESLPWALCSPECPRPSVRRRRAPCRAAAPAQWRRHGLLSAGVVSRGESHARAQTSCVCTRTMVEKVEAAVDPDSVVEDGGLRLAGGRRACDRGGGFHGAAVCVEAFYIIWRCSLLRRSMLETSLTKTDEVVLASSWIMNRQIVNCLEAADVILRRNAICTGHILPLAQNKPQAIGGMA